MSFALFHYLSKTPVTGVQSRLKMKDSNLISALSLHLEAVLTIQTNKISVILELEHSIQQLNTQLSCVSRKHNSYSCLRLSEVAFSEFMRGDSDLEKRISLGISIIL